MGSVGFMYFYLPFLSYERGVGASGGGSSSEGKRDMGKSIWHAEMKSCLCLLNCRYLVAFVICEPQADRLGLARLN